MNLSFQTMAAIRFGFGLSPKNEPPATAEDMFARLNDADEIAQKYPIKALAVRQNEAFEYGKLRKARKNGEDGADEALKKAMRAGVAERWREMRITMVRPLVSPDGFRERLVRFWADHFAIHAKGKGLRFLTAAYIDEAIRPNIAGKFSDLLRAAAIHPVMMIFLDQPLSIGPNSPAGITRNRGLNENLAREILELHSLGVGGGYQQVDVRQFAELLTGLDYNFRHGFRFLPRRAEPGKETVLGQSYSGRSARLSDIHEILDDLAVHPDTARHIAEKLVVHFISDTPDEALVDHVAAAFTDSDGDLMAVYEALLSHPRAWTDFGQKAKKPFEFMVSAMRAMAVDPDRIETLDRRKTRLFLAAPLQIMGQPYQQPGGPDGWPEPIEDWITPQGLAARVQWALIAANTLGSDLNPREFAQTALADAASPHLLQVAGYAESRREGMALVLASPEFNRR